MIRNIFSPKVIKALAMALAVFAQGIVFFISYLVIKPYASYITIVLEGVSLLVVFYLVKSDINPVYKIPWIVILLLFPIFGGVLYIIYGRAHIGKKEARRFNYINLQYKNALTCRPGYNEELKKMEPYIGVQTDYLNLRADAPVYKNTDTEYFPLGDTMFPVMLRELSRAQKYIFMEYFIIEDGVMLDAILTILEKKAEEGLDVRFMYDSFGSMIKAPLHIVKRLTRKGIHCFEFNSFRTVVDSRYNNRDHRKICVIDGLVGFTGGLNLADEYINRKQLFGHWKDSAIMLKGDAVWSLTIMFLALWDYMKQEEDSFEKYMPDQTITIDNGFVAPYTDYPLDDEAVGKNVYLNMINRAKEYVYITSPYLVLDNVMITALENAAKMGVDIRIITPGIPDKKIVNMLTKSYYEVLIKAGVRIYEYTPGFMHAKNFISDDETGVIGTINLDYRSLTHHFENAVWMYKTSAVLDMKKDFYDTIRKCYEVTKEDCQKQSIIRKILLPILRLFSPMF